MSKGQTEGRYSKKIAKAEAKVYFDLGYKVYVSYLKQSKINDSSMNVYMLEPGMVNIAFACEIAMKVMYEVENQKMIHGHKLYSELYLSLSEEQQNTISEKTIERMKNKHYCGYTHRSFVDDLTTCDNIFQEARYSFEYIPGTVGENLKPGFLIIFASVLIEILEIYSF